MNVPLFRPRLGKRSRDYLETALESGAWASGPHVKVFEDQLAEYTGYDHVIAVNSGTMAARLIWLALADEEFFVTGPTLAFASPYIEADLIGRWIPGFCDIDRDSWCLDTFQFVSSQFARAAVIALDYGGWPCPTPKTDGVLWIRDAAHGVRREMAREGAPIAFFAFHPTKPVAGLGGGAIALSSEYARLEPILRRLRDFGRMRKGATYTIQHYGTNGYMPNASAAVALGSLEDVAETDGSRWEIAGQYYRELPHGIQFRKWNAGCSYHLFPVLLPRGSDRDRFIEFMKSRGIEVGIHYPLVHELPYFSKITRQSLPVAEDVGPRLVSLPIWAGMSSEQVQYVCDTIRLWLEGPSRSGATRSA